MKGPKVLYPAIFHSEDGSYWVEFPDLEGCHSFGSTLQETFENAQEALAGYCVTLLEQERKLNPASDIKSLQIPDEAFATLIEADLIPKSKAVKKTLTVPSWLNDIAESSGVNFSATLQNALMSELGLVQS